MAIALASQATSRFESQFVLNALVPTAVFLPLSGAVVGDSVWGLSRLLEDYGTLPTALRVILPVIGLAGIWLVASIVASQWANIVQAFEGYPLISFFHWMSRHPRLSALEKWFGIPGIDAHADRREMLKIRVGARTLTDTELDLNYDLKSEVLPTRLGNILHAAEMYPYHHYGIDVIVFWTRLAMLMPPEILSDVERLINRYQLPLVISAWAAVFSVIAIVPGITGHLVLFLVTLWGGFAIAYVSYAMSLRSAQDYGVALRSAFDVYRDRLVESWPPLEYVESDRGRFRRLREFVVPKVPSSPGTVQGSQLGGEGEKQGREPLRDEGSKSGSSNSDRGGGCSSKIRFSLLLAALWGLGWSVGCASMLLESRYLVVTAAVPPYMSLTGLTQVVSLPRSKAPNRPQNRLAVHSHDGTLLATKALKANEVLTRDNAVDLEFKPAGMLQVKVSPTQASQLSIEGGSFVSLVFAGQADFHSDMECRNAQGNGAARVVEGEVVSIAGRGQSELTVVVAVNQSSLTSIVCYGSEHVSLSAAVR